MESLLADLVRRLDQSKVESHILVLQYRGRFAQGLEGSATIHDAIPMSRWSMVRPVALAARLRAIGPDVVHTHSGVWYKASLAARMAGVPRVIHTEHGRAARDPLVARWLDGRASRRTDVVVGVSASVADALRRRVVWPGCRVDVILNGVDTDRFCPRPGGTRLRAELGVAADVPVIGSIGRLEPIKGYEVMIEAFRALLATNPATNAMLAIAGDGSQRQALQERIDASGIAGRVRLLGWRDDRDALLQRFDCFTMSSHSEGTSISLLEAMSSELCPVVTDVGGNRAVLGDALTHRLVTPGRPEELAAAWTRALMDPERRRADARAARERVLSTYSLTRMVVAYERLYRHGAVREGHAESRQRHDLTVSPA
jgi:glycosyltransferase involved in cell wall biosynthesis